MTTTEEHSALDAEALVRKGIRLAAAGRVADAVAALSSAVEAAPENAFGHIHLALCLSTEGRFDEAQAHLKRALELQPNSAALRLFAGQIEFDAGDYRSAQSEFRRAGELSPDNVLAGAFLKLSEWAEGSVESAMALDADDLPDSTPFLARLLMLIETEMRGHTVDLEDSGEATPLLDRPRVAYMLWRAEGARKRGDLETAVGFVEMALEMRPGHRGALQCLRACREDALAAAERKVEEDAASAEARIELAGLLADAERFAEAEARLSEAGERLGQQGRGEEAKLPEFSRLAGRIAYGLGRIDEALDLTRAGAEPGITMAEVHYCLGLCHLARGERHLGALEFERLVSKLWWAVPLRYREYRQWRRTKPQ